MNYSLAVVRPRGFSTEVFLDVTSASPSCYWYGVFWCELVALPVYFRVGMVLGRVVVSGC